MNNKWVSSKKLFKALLVLLLIVPSTCNNKTAHAKNFRADIRSSGITTFRPSFALNNYAIDTFFNASKRPEEYLEIASTKVISRNTKTEKRVVKHEEIKKSSNRKNSNSKKEVMSGVNDILVAAIEAYDGPEIKVTSGLRHSGYKRSLHRIGKAIDIHFCEEFVDWCETEKGKKWLMEYNLEFFIEDNTSSTKETLPNKFIKFWRLIPWATSKHIHLNMKQ